MSKTALIILTYNAASFIDMLFLSVNKQTLIPNHLLAVDSSSTDDTFQNLKQHGIKIHKLPQSEFNHGGTRQLAAEMVGADILIYLTQDAIPANPETFKNIVRVFDNPKVGCAYGRQLPSKNAGILGAHLRLFNYPEQSRLKTLADKNELGIKTCFSSDSFAAYRKSALMEVGGFPKKIIVGEDVYVAAKMLLAGYAVQYVADAQVFHSHDYTALQEFKRYFDIGVFHASEPWLLEDFNSPNKEGVRYVRSELTYCLKHRSFIALWQSCIHTFMKLLGYRLGRRFKMLPQWFIRRLSAQRYYWRNLGKV